MTVYSWIGAKDGSWATAARWTPSGGPQTGSDFPFNSNDDAVFATGSTAHYTVTTGGESASLRVTGDHVTFDHFVNSDGGYGGGLLLNGGARVTVTSSSALNYFSHDGYGGGGFEIDHAQLTDHGYLSGFGGTIGPAGLLTLSGTQATLVTLSGMDIGAGGRMVVSGGATYSAYTPGDPNGIAGSLTVTGQGSSASLGSAGGTGTVEVANHATIDVHTTTTGSLHFIVGNYAGLELDAAVSHATRIDFAGQHGSLTLQPDLGSGGQNYVMHGVIGGFSRTDALVLDGTPVTHVLYTPGANGVGSLKLFDGSKPVGTLAIAGNYTGRQFSVTQVSPTESRITEQPTTPLGHLIEAMSDVVAELKLGVAHLDGIVGGLGGNGAPVLDRSAWQAIAQVERPLAGLAETLLQSGGGDWLSLAAHH